MQIQVNTGRQIESGAKLTDEIKSIVQQALARYADRITRLEIFLSDENTSQKSGDSDKRCVIEARVGGLRPVIVSHQAASIDQVVAGATDKLEKTLKRTLGRKTSILRRRGRERAELSGAAPVLEHDVEAGKRDDFLKVLRPLLGHLGRHARRELRIMEANGTLYPGQVIFAHLLDEVVTRAWLQFADRPRWMALDLWLTKILDELLEETIREDERIHGPIAGQTNEMSGQKLPKIDDQDWWLWLLGEDETMTGDDSFTNGQSTWADELLEAEEFMYLIHALLGKVPTARRRAFVLNAFDAFEVSEIALLQGRSEKDIRDDIEAVRNQLAERLRAGLKSQTSGQEVIGHEV